MTPERRAELREAVQKMTPGEWVVDYGGTLGHIKAVVEGASRTPTVARYDVLSLSIPDETKSANAHGIALLKNNAEALLDAADERDRLAEAALSPAEWRLIRECITYANHAYAGRGGNRDYWFEERLEKLEAKVRAALTKDQT